MQCFEDLRDDTSFIANRLGAGLLNEGRLEDARAAYAECLEQAQRLGDLLLSASAALNLGTLAQRRGQLGDAYGHVARAVSLARRGDMRATLAMAGITGMKYIEITRDPDSTPLTVPFKTEHPIIPSKKSATGQLFEAIEKVYDKIMETDFPGIGENAKEALAEIESVAQDPNIDKLIAQLAGAAERVNYLVHKHETEQTIVELAQTLTELRGLVATIKTSIEQADLKSTFGDLRLAAPDADLPEFWTGRTVSLRGGIVAVGDLPAHGVAVVSLPREGA